MTDIEINKALALAIGWREDQLIEIRGRVFVRSILVFDYRDWSTIGPIAERFDCFPWRRGSDGWWTTEEGVYADTPQKAIALAAIGKINDFS